MSDTSLKALSRRSALRKFAVTAGGAALVASGARLARAADAPTKMAQKDVAYQPTPHQGQACSTCSQFEPPTGCKVVEGKISAAGWCQLYVKKT